MGKFFRDIWSEVIAAGVLASMTILISKLQGIDPLLLAIVTFVVLLIAFRVIYYLQERKLKKRLNIEKGRWSQVREKRIKLRLRYSNCTRIPDLLYKMSERVRELMEKNPMELVIADYDEGIVDDFREIMQVKDVKRIKLDTTDTKKLLAKFPILKKYKDPTHQARALVISLYQVLTAHGEGAKFLVDADDDYQQLAKQVEELLVGLPQSIHVKKDSHTQLANAYYTIMAIDFDKSEQPKLFRLYQPFLKTAIVSELSTMRADILSSIEKFLVGEDMK